jgi:hypothetical protein
MKGEKAQAVGRDISKNAYGASGKENAYGATGRSFDNFKRSFVEGTQRPSSTNLPFLDPY